MKGATALGVWLVGTDVMANSRFAVSPLVETVAALKALEGHPTVGGQQSWIDTHRPAYQALVAADPFVAALLKAVFRPRWLADFLISLPAGPHEGFSDELRRVRATPPDAVRAELAANYPGPLPARLAGDDLTGRAADLLEWVWTHTVRPDWPRRRRLLEADIVSRTHQLSAGGLAAALDGIRPGVRWLGEGRLQVNPYDLPPEYVADATLMFIPSTSRRGWVTLDAPDRYAVVYPCSGTLADAAGAAPPRALIRLLGPVRADILAQLESPRTPTQLVASTGYGLGSVGGHLKVLLDARLVRRRRSGRNVLYYRSPGGDCLVRMDAG